MGQNVQSGVVRIPVRAVEVEAILRDAGEVHRTEERRVGGPIGVVRGRLSDVVNTGPDEFPNIIVEVIVPDEVVLRQLAPSAVLHIVAARLMIRVNCHRLTLDRELIDPSRRECRSGLGTQDQSLRQLGIRLGVVPGAVIEAGDIHDSCKVICRSGLGVVHPLSDGAGGILAMSNLLEEVGDLIAPLSALLVDLVADAPHDDGGGISVVTDETDEVALCPVAEEGTVPILHLRDPPLVEALRHNQHPHLVCQLDQLRSGHIV